MTTKELVWREVTLQRPYEMETLWAILTHIAALTSRGQLVWEARCKDGKMRYMIGTPKWSVTRVQEAFKAHANVQFTDNAVREPVNLARRVKISRPVLSLNTEVSGAMIRAALAAMTGAKKDTECALQIVLGAPHTPSTVPKRVPDPTESWLEVVLGSVHNASAEQRRTMREKADQYSFEAVVRLGVSGEHTTTRLNNIISAMRTLEAAGVHIRAERESAEHLDKAALPWRMPLRLSVKETACFLLLPAGEEELPGTPGLHPKLLLPPKWYREPSEKADRTFAMTLGSDPKRLSIAPKDALEHSLLVGPTGSGKSTAMQSMILSDIKAGRSVLVVDPKADLVTSILERIPEERKNDVVVLDPSDPSPVGFNPLALPGDPTLITDSILAVFQELFSQNWGIRSADILSGALLTLTQIKGANLLWLPQMLIDENFRRELTAKVKDPIALQPFWNHFEAMKDTERRTEIAPVLNKLRQITYRPGLRNVLGQSEPKFSLADLFYKRRIVLVPLNRGLIGAESARLLGSLIVGLTWSLALSRANIAPEKRHTVSIFIDELQDYLALPTSFNDALAQARGLGVAYTVAHQYRGQLPPDIKAGIDANCRNKIASGKEKWSVSTVKSILSNEKYRGDALLQKTYTVDYLTKEVRKNDGEVRQFFVENSHEAIINPETFDQVQEMLEHIHKRRSKIRTKHPFAGKIVCGDCGEFFGHKVWRIRSTGEHYNVWYCNHKYDGETRCATPYFKENDICAAFEKVMLECEEEQITFSEEAWNRWVSKVTSYKDGCLKFILTDGKETEIAL